MSTINSKLQRDVTINVISALINVLGIVLLTRTSTAFFAPVAFGLFTLVRRYSTSLATFTDLGGSIAQYRYMGMFANEKRMRQMVSLSVLVFYICITIVVVAVSFFFQKTLIRLALGTNDLSNAWVLWYSIGLGLQNLLLYNLVNNLLQERRMVLYNVVSAMNAFGIFVLIFLFSSASSVRSVLLLYLILGDLMAVVGLAYYNVLPLLKWREFPWNKLGWTLREVFSYGLLRGLGAALSTGLFFIGPWLIRSDLAEVGYIGAVYLFVQSTGVIILPITRLSMVVSARQLTNVNDERLGTGIRLLFGVVFVGVTILMVAVYPILDLLFRSMISKREIIIGVQQYTLVMTCIIPLSIFSALKGVIDIRWKIPFNFINLLICQILGIVAFYMLKPLYGQVVAVIGQSLVAFWMVGILTVVTCRSYLRSIRWSEMAIFTGLAGVFFVGVIVLKDMLILDRMSLVYELLMAGVTAISLPLLWWLICKPYFIEDLLQQTGWDRIILRLRAKAGRSVGLEGHDRL